MDSHLAELTVKETMDFSARVQGPGTKRGAAALPSPQCMMYSAASCVKSIPRYTSLTAYIQQNGLQAAGRQAETDCTLGM